MASVYLSTQHNRADQSSKPCAGAEQALDMTAALLIAKHGANEHIKSFLPLILTQRRARM